MKPAAVERKDVDDDPADPSQRRGDDDTSSVGSPPRT
jgi:hypothetical protein